jgi:pilus assembly protein CpaF
MSLADRLAQAKKSRIAELDDATGPKTHGPGQRPRRNVDPFAELKREVHQSLLETLGPKLYDAQLSQPELEAKVRKTLQEVLAREETPLTLQDRTRIAQEVADDILGYGPLEPFLRDSDITEVMVNGFDSIYVERSGKIFEVDGGFTDEGHLRRTIDKIVARVGRRVDEASPMVDARLPDGSRVNAIIPPLALDGSLLTIRKFAADPFEVEDLIGFGTVNRPVADFLAACVRGRVNVLVSGGAGAGKTTTLNVLSSFIPEDERIVTIEDAAELQLHQQHVLRLEARPPNIEGRGEVRIRELVRNALRMRPDRIVVGEVRDEAALDMLQAMNTGHDGSIGTVHANSPRDVLARVETMVLMAGMDLPIRAIREQMASAIDLIVHLQRFRTAPGTSRTSPRSWAWRATSSPSRTCSSSITGSASMITATRSESCAPRGCVQPSSRSSRTLGCGSTRQCSRSRSSPDDPPRLRGSRVGGAGPRFERGDGRRSRKGSRTHREHRLAPGRAPRRLQWRRARARCVDRPGYRGCGHRRHPGGHHRSGTHLSVSAGPAYGGHGHRHEL